MSNAYRPPDDEDAAGAVQGFVAVLFLFKIATVVLIFWHLRTWQTGLFLGATTWYFLPLLAVIFSGPALFAVRLRRARAKRRELLQAEWMVEPEHEPTDGAATRR